MTAGVLFKKKQTVNDGGQKFSASIYDAEELADFTLGRAVFLEACPRGEECQVYRQTKQGHWYPMEDGVVDYFRKHGGRDLKSADQAIKLCAGLRESAQAGEV